MKPEDFDWFREPLKQPTEADGSPQPNGAGQLQKKEVRMLVPSQLTEELLAEQFENKWDGELQFDHNYGRWFFWSAEGGLWRKNETRLAFYYARDICRESNVTGAKEFAKASAYTGVERICQASPLFAVTSEVWDPDPWLLGVPGGTVDLRTGQLRTACKQDHITKQTAVAPNWQLACPVFTKFLHEITMQNEELKAYLQRIAGYALTGSVREQKLFFIYGEGKNGKSLFLTTLSKIMGDYAVDAAMDTFIRKRGERHPTDIAALRGARLVTAIETEEGRHWDEALIKKLTGGEVVTARFMRRDFFTYMPQFTLIFAGNHAPLLSNVSDAIRRRFQMIPFEFKPGQPDKRLEEKLQAEFPAILAWAVDGARAWNADGLPEPAVISQETEEYFSGQDQLAAWLEECCLVGPNYQDQSSVIFESWRSWSKNNGALEEAPSNKRLTGLLKDRRLVRVRRGRSGSVLHGLAVKVEYQPDPRTGERDEAE